MFNDLIKSTTETLKERLASPLLGSFAIAWSVVNYKVIVLLLSKTEATVIFGLIDTTIFPDTRTALLNCFAYPLLAALFYVFIYPYFALVVYKYTLARQLKTNAAKQMIAKETLLTLEDSQRLRSEYVEYERLQRAEVERLQEEVVRLKVALDEARKPPLTPTVAPIQQLPEAQISGNQGLIGSVITNGNKTKFRAEKAYRLARKFEAAEHILARTGEGITTVRTYELEPAQGVLLWKLAELGGNTSADELIDGIKADRVQFEYDMGILGSKRFVKASNLDSNDTSFALTQAGREIALTIRKIVNKNLLADDNFDSLEKDGAEMNALLEEGTLDKILGPITKPQNAA